MNVKHLSARGIRQKLYEKGIDRDLIDEVIEAANEDNGGNNES